MKDLIKKRLAELHERRKGLMFDYGKVKPEHQREFWYLMGGEAELEKLLKFL